MKLAAIGIRAHSGWAALVAVSGEPGRVQVLARRRMVMADPQGPGAKQPYHFAQKLGFTAARQHLASCAAASERLAVEEIRVVVEELNGRQYEVAGAVILLGSGRPLPLLPQILASHALIHAAEGEFFRQTVRQACERLGIRVTCIRERELAAQLTLQSEIANLGKTVGPPWTQDQKTAALGAMVLLTG